MLYIETLEVDDHILEKIETKHGVTLDEAEDVCYSDSHHVRKGRTGLYKVFGRTTAGRFILVVLAHKGRGDWKVVTAREMTENETKLFREATR